MKVAIPEIVTTTPTILSSVSSSPKTQAEMVIVVTSLKIPAIDSGTDPARWMMLVVRIGVVGNDDAHKYSLATMEKARPPGKRITPTVCSALPP